MTQNRKLKIFLCHSKGDKLKVRKLYKRLIADNFDVWLDDENLIPGQDWDFEIKKAVRSADIVIVCLSFNSITKEGYIQKEIGFALDIAGEKPEGTIFLIPARMENCEVPYRLSKYQWIDLFSRGSYQKLIEALLLRMNDLRIRFTKDELTTANGNGSITIPILGFINANNPFTLTRQPASIITHNVEIPTVLLPHRANTKKLFALEVFGNSLIDAMINDGDYVIMEPATSVRNGAMAAIWLSKQKEITLKYFYKEKYGYRLQPADPAYKPILLGKEEPLEIKGKVMMVIRKLAK